VALARAFMRDAKILLLDEPTSALDAQAEYDLFERLHSLTKAAPPCNISTVLDGPESRPHHLPGAPSVE